MVKVRALRGIRVVIIFVVELGVVFWLSVAIVYFIVDVHTWYACHCAIDSLHDVFRAASFILQFLLFVLFEVTWPDVVAELAALVACDIFVYLRCSLVVALAVVLRECQVIFAL